MSKRSPYSTRVDAHVLAQVMLEADPSDFDLDREVKRMTTYRCPDCGSDNTSQPDDEGLVDCGECGVWFDPFHARNRHALHQKLPEALDDIDPQHYINQAERPPCCFECGAVLGLPSSVRQIWMLNDVNDEDEEGDNYEIETVYGHYEVEPSNSPSNVLWTFRPDEEVPSNLHDPDYECCVKCGCHCQKPMREAIEEAAPTEGDPNDDYLLDPDTFINYAMQHGAKPRIRTSYSVTTPESAADGDYAETGWHDEEGVTFELDEFDIEDGLTLADIVIKWLHSNGAYEASSSQFHPGVWYTSHSEDYTDGSDTEYNYHLYDFTPEDEAEIFKKFHER